MVAEKANTLDTDESAHGSDGNSPGDGMEKLRLLSGMVWQITQSRWFRITAVVTVISLPILIGLLYRLTWSLPAHIVVANGPEGGFYEAITERLSKEIERRTGNDVDVTMVRTDGSLTNLRLLQEGQVDFALYQAGTEELVNGLESCFTLRDKNGDGELILAEFTCPFPIVDVFSKLDIDGNDSLTRDEYSAPRAVALKADARRGKLTFNRLDTNEDGVLSLSEYKDTSTIEFLANVASEAMHVIVDRESSLTSMEDLRGKTVALGPKNSGNYAASLIVLEHCGLAECDQNMRWEFSFTAVDNLNYMDIKKGLLEGRLDAALVNASTQSPILKELLGSGKCQLLSVPQTEALSATNPLISQYKIPEGIYRCDSNPSAFVPSANIDTIALSAQLLTRNDVHEGLVARVTQIILNEEFEKKGKLNTLFVADKIERRAIACQRPEFPIHQGALAVYQPIGIDYYGFEKWHALYSLVASACVAAFVGYRWIRRQRARNRIVHLEQYVDALFDIERRQLALDVKPSATDVEELRHLLDRVTLLRQRALREFSSHEVIEDPAVNCFVQICHFVSTKLDAKISRQRLDSRFDELASSGQRDKVLTGSSKKQRKTKKTTSRAKKGPN